jgi:hypothetical protein
MGFAWFHSGGPKPLGDSPNVLPFEAFPSLAARSGHGLRRDVHPNAIPSRRCLRFLSPCCHADAPRSLVLRGLIRQRVRCETDSVAATSLPDAPLGLWPDTRRSPSRLPLSSRASCDTRSARSSEPAACTEVLRSDPPSSSCETPSRETHTRPKPRAGCEDHAGPKAFASSPTRSAAEATMLALAGQRSRRLAAPLPALPKADRRPDLLDPKADSSPGPASGASCFPVPKHGSVLVAVRQLPSPVGGPEDSPPG